MLTGNSWGFHDADSPVLVLVLLGLCLSAAGLLSALAALLAGLL